MEDVFFYPSNRKRSCNVNWNNAKITTAFNIVIPLWHNTGQLQVNMNLSYIEINILNFRDLVEYLDGKSSW